MVPIKSIAVAKSESGKPAAKGSKKDSNKFTKLSIYMIYNKQRFPEVKKLHPEMAFSDVSKMICAEYQKMNETEKKKYQITVDIENIKRRK